IDDSHYQLSCGQVYFGCLPSGGTCSLSTSGNNILHMSSHFSCGDVLLGNRFFNLSCWTWSNPSSRDASPFRHDLLWLCSWTSEVDLNFPRHRPQRGW